jgi:hypothetical protein
MLRTIDALRLDATRQLKESEVRAMLAQARPRAQPCPAVLGVTEWRAPTARVQMVAPSQWHVSSPDANGQQEVLVQTPWQLRQRELVELYHGLGAQRSSYPRG